MMTKQKALNKVFVEPLLTPEDHYVGGKGNEEDNTVDHNMRQKPVSMNRFELSDGSDEERENPEKGLVNRGGGGGRVVPDDADECDDRSKYLMTV